MFDNEKSMAFKSQQYELWHTVTLKTQFLYKRRVKNTEIDTKFVEFLSGGLQKRFVDTSGGGKAPGTSLNVNERTLALIQSHVCAYLLNVMVHFETTRVSNQGLVCLGICEQPKRMCELRTEPINGPTVFCDGSDREICSGSDLLIDV